MQHILMGGWIGWMDDGHWHVIPPEIHITGAKNKKMTSTVTKWLQKTNLPSHNFIST